MFANRYHAGTLFQSILIFRNFAFILTAVLFLHGFNVCANVHPGDVQESGCSDHDTIFIKKGSYKLSKRNTITLPRDTFYVEPYQNTGNSIPGPYQQSKVFYDTMYKKFTRNKLTQLLYYLAFVEPKHSDLPDTAQILKSAIPFIEFQGKVIRKIDIKVFAPFGTSIYDTGRHAQTGIGHTLNRVHINTKKYVIRRNLLIKMGDRLNPELLADNERLLRNITAIDNARILVCQTSPGSDSVDLTVVAKDVWSIGIDVPVITTQKVRFRVYDANFLGLGDKLTTNMSLGLNRAPFFMFEGGSYTFSNIRSSLINITLGYSADHVGNNKLLLEVDRPFMTYLTKWAGGAYATLETIFDEQSYEAPITLYTNNQGIWLGRAFLLNNRKESPRAVIAVGADRHDYSSRPPITIDTNKVYFNHLQVLATFSISKNYYYLTDYLMNFGKTENLPYGGLFQITLGPDQRELYTRLYSGIHLSAGNFFNKFGYIAGYIKFSGFINSASFEDAVLKFNLFYFSPLLKTLDKRYRFRSFYSLDYRTVINSRSTNHEYFDANKLFKIDKVNNSQYFDGANIVSARLSTICYTPWYFYGFRFAGMISLQSGLVSKKTEPLLKAALFSGVGLSIIIKNDNLVFPAFLVSGYYYPATSGNFNQFQFVVNSNLNLQNYDFNVTAPHEENLAN